MSKSLTSITARFVTVGVALGVTLGQTPAVFADDGGHTPAEVAMLVSEAVAVAVPTTPKRAPSVSADVDIPTDPDLDVEVGLSDGPALGVSLPEGLDLSRGVATEDGTAWLVVLNFVDISGPGQLPWAGPVSVVPVFAWLIWMYVTDARHRRDSK